MTDHSTRSKFKFHETAYLLLGLIIYFLVAAVGISRDQVQEVKREAVQRGHAVWQTDENGNTTFTWK